MKNEEHLKKLVKRYLNNQATADELEVFVHLHKLGALDQILNECLDEQILYNEVIPKRWPLKRLIPVAATVTLLLMSTFLLYSNRNYLKDLFYPDALTIVETGSKEIKNVRLADGSIVTLNRNSAISFREEWSNTAREVSLTKGEAYFKIKKTADCQPFLVRTEHGLEINVLGTEFNVSDNNNATLVYLENGKVMLNTKNGQAMLSPGELASYNQAHNSINVQRVESDRSLAWKNNLFVFEDETLRDISLELEEYYGVKIELPIKGIDQLRFTGKVSRSNMNTVMSVIAETLNLKIKQNGQALTFYTLK
ncbi:FecR family protein [Dyadobacter sp. NIV53]|uniref:FecR family protein n=1 Tax=Dyadobacter sp. NIV53 TaxID=2861765 RepID=UPI001C8758A6|nr:FecR domain-containing protein [Dyadobacter sp. NIV53]